VGAAWVPVQESTAIPRIHYFYVVNNPSRMSRERMVSPSDIGTALVRTRRAQGMSQRELGSRVGVVQQQIARWEAAYRTAPLARVEAVARELGSGVTLAGEATETTLLAAESTATYGAATTTGVVPVRDLGEIAARIPASGDVFRDRFGVARIGVFGSFVYGEQTRDSDVDLLVVFTRKPSGFAYFEPAIFAEELLGREVDLVEPAFLRERLRDRVLGDTVYVWSA
jgi:predicted nucleotidyltransferase